MPVDPGRRLKAGDLDHTLGYKLRLAQISAWRSFEEKHPQFGNAPRYFGLLMVVASNPGHPQGALARAIAIRRASIVPILDKLEEDGLLERRASPRDRRVKAVWLTQKGSAVVAELKAIAQRNEAELRAGLDPRDVETAIAVLDQIVERLGEA